jgi:hypothetical protein
MSRRSGKPDNVSKKQRALRADTAERLEAIVEAAERAAESVIDDAEAQARRYLAQARAEADRLGGGKVEDLSELIDSLLGQAVSLRHEAGRLQATLEQAKIRFGSGGKAEPSPEPVVDDATHDAPRLRAVVSAEPPAGPPLVSEEPSAGPPEGRPDPAGARLLATQMAVSGSSREEIEQRLRNGFEIEDTDAILDAILGPEE